MISKQEPITAAQYLRSFWQPARDTVSQIMSEGFRKSVIAVALGWVSAFIQDHLEGFLILMVLVVLDWGSGVVAAIRQKKFNSFRFRAGLLKIFMYGFLIAGFHILGYLNPVLESIKLDTFAILYLAATEALSIVENVQITTGIKLPSWIHSIIEHLGKKK